MASGVSGKRNGQGSGLRSLLPWSWLGLALASTSCTPGAALGSAQIGASATSAPALVINLPIAATARTVAPLPIPSAQQPPALLQATPVSFAFRGRTALDNLRSHDCLAQAIYYEAASESEEGQRAVAQVVLNRVRHPAWPNSVCGVVYQGPMRPGGGCQFTFTCDGSLFRPASGAAWAQARRLADEALAGRSFSAVGLATHYHTHAVSPAWAPRLATVGSIGAHIFYRLPGRVGQANAFASTYAGSEPLPRPSAILFPRRSSSAGLASYSPTAFEASAGQVAVPSLNVEANVAAAEVLPPSTIRDEYRHSGQWRADAPVAITGH